MEILIAADAETLQAERTARDIAKEAELVRAATRRAKDFRATLDVFGLTFSGLLALSEEAQAIGDIARNILIGWESERI